MWAKRDSGDFLSKSGEVKPAGDMKGDNSESQRILVVLVEGWVAFWAAEYHSKERRVKKYWMAWTT